ncbi:tyrosine-type recombinase/integrase [Jiangella endophytica]|uniref:tyrosine-type recombinase/integrase n=1 Tax=Jiangella endophytica TaxID=1623398 RepID=UPI000E350D1F|nr:tyrosine-type recombinase/integrase [Jiangella endophytica]
MRATTYNVRVWKTSVYKGSRVRTYTVRWGVAGEPFREPFRTAAQAESFRSDLVAAARKGEAFYVDTGLPVSMKRAEANMSWYELVCAYTDTKWPKSAATTRRTVAEALTAATCLMFSSERGMPDGVQLRSALTRWAFNTTRRDDPNRPAWVSEALRWASSHTRPAADLADADVLRQLLDGLAVRLDGGARAASVTSRWRKILYNLAEYAVDRKVLIANPLSTVKQPAQRIAEVDPRSVANPTQARDLFTAVAAQGTTGQRLEAYFGCLYYAAMRPEEAADLSRHNLDLPEKGWGWIYLEAAKPHAGSDWTDTGMARDSRPLKQRNLGEVRKVPSTPELTALLHHHLATFGTTPDGRLFVGERSTDHLPAFTVFRVWSRAREAVFGSAARRSLIALRPYDLRHACVSTWLNSGVPPTKAAAWAGHSVDVLLKIYAKCVDGDDELYRDRIDAALGPGRGPRKLRHVFDKNGRREPPGAVDGRTDKNGPSPAF